MAYKVVAAPEFIERFETAVEYRHRYFGTTSATRLIEAQERIISLLASTPFMGATVQHNADKVPETSLRWVRMDAYIVIYRPHPDTQTVLLADIFHASANWREHVKNRPA